MSSKPANSGSGYFVDQQIDEYLGQCQSVFVRRLYAGGGAGKMADAIEGEEEVNVIDFNAAEEPVNAMMVYFFQYFPYIFLSVMILGISFLCGIFVPQYMLGDGVLAEAHFLPAYWYIRNSNMIGGFSDETMSFAVY